MKTKMILIVILLLMGVGFANELLWIEWKTSRSDRTLEYIDDSGTKKTVIIPNNIKSIPYTSSIDLRTPFGVQIFKGEVEPYTLLFCTGNILEDKFEFIVPVFIKNTKSYQILISYHHYTNTTESPKYDTIAGNSTKRLYMNEGGNVVCFKTLYDTVWGEWGNDTLSNLLRYDSIFISDTGNIRINIERNNISQIKLSVYPNPFNDKVNFGLRSLGDISIFTLNGRRVTSFNNVRNINWDASREPSGIYIARVKVNNRTFSKRIYFVR